MFGFCVQYSSNCSVILVDADSQRAFSDSYVVADVISSTEVPAYSKKSMKTCSPAEIGGWS